jgi:CheY-like chemotaxis protein
MMKPRVLVVMRSQWPRALLLAALLEEGYDAVGWSSLTEALTQAVAGPVGLIVADHHISRDNPQFQTLLQRYAEPPILFLESVFQASTPADSEHHLRYPLFIDDVVQEVERLLPLNR